MTVYLKDLLQTLFLQLVLHPFGPLVARKQHWIHFRGSGLNGIAEADSAPVEWNDSNPILWKTDISGRGWSSPVVSGELLISNGSAVCIAYRPQTGEEVWRIEQGEDSTIPMPVAGGGLVYCYPEHTLLLDAQTGEVVYSKN